MNDELSGTRCSSHCRVVFSGHSGCIWVWLWGENENGISETIFNANSNETYKKLIMFWKYFHFLTFCLIYFLELHMWNRRNTHTTRLEHTSQWNCIFFAPTPYSISMQTQFQYHSSIHFSFSVYCCCRNGNMEMAMDTWIGEDTLGLYSHSNRYTIQRELKIIHIRQPLDFQMFSTECHQSGKSRLYCYSVTSRMSPLLSFRNDDGWLRRNLHPDDCYTPRHYVLKAFGLTN